jgi:hypothetical protein
MSQIYSYSDDDCNISTKKRAKNLSATLNRILSIFSPNSVYKS